MSVSPPGMPHCDEAGHLLRKVIDEDGQVRQHCVRTIHAEENAIIQAAKFGVSIEGSTLYCKMEPCRACAMSIVAAGIKKVVCEKHYHAAEDTKGNFLEMRCGASCIEKRSRNLRKYVTRKLEKQTIAKHISRFSRAILSKVEQSKRCPNFRRYRLNCNYCCCGRRPGRAVLWRSDRQTFDCFPDCVKYTRG